MEEKSFADRLRSFWDFLILFSGISTARNLSRTRTDPVRRRGLFLFRKSRPEARTDSQELR
jgi:hypothetical protein